MFSHIKLSSKSATQKSHSDITSAWFPMRFEKLQMVFSSARSLAKRYIVTALSSWKDHHHGSTKAGLPR